MKKRLFKPLATAIAAALQFAATAAVPLVWDVVPTRATPAKFDRYHGETLDLKATFRGFGTLPFVPGADVRLYYQTNGMGAAWWSTSASVSSNVVTGTFSPNLDPGADSVTVFFGAPSNAYASAIIKLRPSPGFSPAMLALPSSAGISSIVEADPVFSEWLSSGGLVPSSSAERLISPDGTVWQDATGTVWQIEREWAWVGTVWTNDAPRSESSPGHTFNVEFLYEGLDHMNIARYTNALFGVIHGSPETLVWWPDGDEGEAGNYFFFNYYSGATNVFSMAQHPDGGLLRDDRWYSAELAYVPVDRATNPVDRVLYKSGGGGGGGEPGNYAAVSNAAMSAVQSDGTDWQNVLSKTSSITPSEYLPYTWYFDGKALASQELGMQSGDGNYEHHLTFNDASMRWTTWYAPTGEEDAYDESTGRRLTQNDIAYLSDIPSPPDLTPYATKSALQSVSNIVEDTRTESALVYRLYSGSNVVAEVTNYNSAVHAPELRLMQLNESNEYFTVWSENNGLTRTLNAAKEYADSATNELKNTYAPRAWSRTTSGLGADAPPDTTWISTPRTVIAGGLEYAKIVDTYGEVWVLTSNGMAADFNPDTNAYFRISADDGTPVFSIEKSDAQVVGAYAEGITVSANSVTMPVPVVSAEAPTMWWSTALESGIWAEQSSPPAGATVTWTGSAGSWVCTVTFSGTRPPSMFFKFSFIQEGGVMIRNNATTDLSTGIWVNGVKFVPSVSGNNLIWTKQ